MTTFFSSIPLAPRDPILGLTETFLADTRAHKINLGVGVYTDENGQIPLMAAVQAAHRHLFEQSRPHGYLPIDGLKRFNTSVQTLLLGAERTAKLKNQLVTVQTLGGTGALKVGADFLKSFYGHARVVISDPSWENHRALFETAGFNVDSYPYYDAKHNRIDFAHMMAAWQNYAAGTIVVLHACCHNPTGLDLNVEQWHEAVQMIQEKKLIPFVDMAYQGFGSGIENDSLVLRLISDANIPCFIANSFSKSFSLYGERVGALTVLTQSETESSCVLSQLKKTIRTNYSNPPSFGAAVVATILDNHELSQQWQQELESMRQRINHNRNRLITELMAPENPVKKDFEFLKMQRGMFSFSGLTKAQIDQLREDFAIYALTNGRICVAALRQDNIGPVVAAIRQILNRDA